MCVGKRNLLDFISSQTLKFINFKKSKILSLVKSAEEFGGDILSILRLLKRIKKRKISLGTKVEEEYMGENEPRKRTGYEMRFLLNVTYV